MRRRRHHVRGAFIALVGPDGSGKTTLATQLQRTCEQHGTEFAYVHWRPAWRAPLPATVPDGPAIPKVVPKVCTTPFDALVSVVRLARSVVVFNVAYAVRVVPALRRGAVVVADRWCYNYALQPASVRYYGPNAVATFACTRLVARPDRVFVLQVDACTIRSRKDELSERQVLEEYERVRTRLACLPVRTLDASQPPGHLVNVIDHDLGHPPWRAEQGVRRG